MVLSDEYCGEYCSLIFLWFSFQFPYHSLTLVSLLIKLLEIIGEKISKPIWNLGLAKHKRCHLTQAVIL